MQGKFTSQSYPGVAAPYKVGLPELNMRFAQCLEYFYSESTVDIGNRLSCSLQIQLTNCKTAIQGKVKEFGGGVDEGKTEGDEGVNAAGYYGIEKKLVKHLSNLLH